MIELSCLIIRLLSSCISFISSCLVFWSVNPMLFSLFQRFWDRLNFFSVAVVCWWWMRVCTWTRKLMRMTAGKGTTNKPNIEKEDDTLRKLAFACLERKWNQHLDRWSKQTNATCNKSQISFRYVLWYRYRYPLISIGTLVVLSFEIFYCSLKDTVAKQRKRGNIET